ncbi:FixH family protein [Chryseomicrobium palamuruense]|uniref:FixH family protein n=1 Tax=Chryseomicrobium palamuruense TaxID=682973 RepID=A0ABV8UQK2_9BACL
MKKWLALVALALVVSGCTQEDSHEDHTMHDEDVAIVEVEIINEAVYNPGDEVTLSARVSQSGEAVDDAEEVLFEVWESGHYEESQKIEGELSEDGVYEATYTFETEGVFYMFAHTTARDMHVMPKQMITIGNPDPADVLEDNSSDTMNHK